MHFGDDYQVDNSVLKLGVYLHKVLRNGTTQLQVTSILEARLISPNKLVRVLTGDTLHKYLAPSMAPEEWYVATLDLAAEGFTILSLEKVEETDTADWKRLHE